MGAIQQQRRVGLQLTVKLDASLWRGVVEQARSAGLTPEEYGREALVARVAFDRGERDRVAERLLTQEGK